MWLKIKTEAFWKKLRVLRNVITEFDENHKEYIIRAFRFLSQNIVLQQIGYKIFKQGNIKQALVDFSSYI